MKRKSKALLLLALAVLTLSLAAVFIGNFNRAAEQYAQTNIQREVSMLIEKTILAYLEESGASYGDFCTLRYSDNGKLSSITIDTLKLNVFKSEVLLRVNNLLSENDSTEFRVPWGNLTGSKWLSGRGGSITIKAVPLGMAAGGTESVFESVGINQSVHRICFELRAAVSLLTPFSHTDCELTSTVCIAETVIIGEVPDVYFGASEQP